MASAEVSLERSDAEATSRGLAARIALYVALVAAWIATCGSLYMSEVLGWIPCQWCWYQRIFMYPLALVLAAGLSLRDRTVPKYALTLAIPGILASTYHIGLQKIPALAKFETCTTTVPCSGDYLNWGGVVTIPMLAWLAFAIVIAGAVIALRAGRDEPGYLDSSPLPVLPPALTVAVIVLAIVLLFGLSGAINRSRQAPASISSLVAASPPGFGPSSDQNVELYATACAGCHGPASAGMQLIRADFLDSRSDLELLDMVRAGRAVNDPENFSGNAMPASGGRVDLTDEQLLALVRYLREAKGG
jgi:disulfide bond formation protein DsbB